MYSLFINLKTGNAKLLNASKGSDYDFEADDSLIKYVQALYEKYDLALTDEHNAVELKTTITTTDDEGSGNGGSTYGVWTDIDDTETTYTCKFPIQREVKKMKLFTLSLGASRLTMAIISLSKRLLI